LPSCCLRGVGAVRRELPIAVVGIGQLLRGVGVCFDQQFIGQRLQLPGQETKELLANVADARAAALIEGSVLIFDQLDAQAFRSDRNFDLLGKFLELFVLISASGFSFSFCIWSLAGTVTASPRGANPAPARVPLFEHRITGSRAVSLAQVVGLVDVDPPHAEGEAAMRKAFE
jgi:hypothetical protein